MLEIERKFLIKKLPDISSIKPIRYERYFVSDNDNKQVRVQKKDNDYELETKIKINNLEYEKTKTKITESDFLKLSNGCEKSIIRDSYLISDYPNITIKIYHKDYEGLARAEIEYDNLEQIETFQLPDWFGVEITGTELGNDNKLIQLSRENFLELLEKYNK